MSRSDVFENVNLIFRDMFEDEALCIKEDTTAKDIEGWDSLMHLDLINEIETFFNIKFTMSEVQGTKNVGELIDALMKHLGAV